MSVCSPEAVSEPRRKHVRALEARRNYLLAREADISEQALRGRPYYKEERVALEVAIALMNREIDARLTEGNR